MYENRTINEFDSIKDATKFLKSLGKNVQARFYPLCTYKKFLTNNSIDWEKYEEHINKKVNSVFVRDVPFDKVKKFPTLSFNELSSFNNAIKMKDLEMVKNCVKNNPKYLINTDNDMPQIIFCGAKTNALYQAARFNNPEALNYILTTLRDDCFWEQLYEKNDMFKLRINVYWDKLLNSLDKKFEKTPLHYACSFGYKEIVCLLLKYNILDRSIKNRKGKTAYEIICSQCVKHDESLANEIRTLFNSHYISLYITPYQSKKPKVIITRDDPFCRMKENSCGMNLFDEELLVGCAGPVPEEVSQKFKESWLKLDRESLSLGHLIYERRGYMLSRAYDVEYTQYFEFLKDYINVNNYESLEKLDNYFENIYDQNKFVDCVDGFTNDIDTLTSMMERMLRLSSSENEENVVDSTSLYNIRNNESDEEMDFSTPPSSPKESPSILRNYNTLINNDMEDISNNDTFNPDDTIFLSNSIPSKEDMYLYEILKNVYKKWKKDELFYVKLFIASCEHLSVKHIKDLPPMNSPRHQKLSSRCNAIHSLPLEKRRNIFNSGEEVND
ncbi:Lethal (1) G0222 [Strongyloides ratti]|uniref:Lethal (1) G0222 n=1 Tax=Strongyloides ratti TaxID=34506 RepID=A0A090MWI4_STRRB|nr:Lethal (1) G0222 [Strongyloides ratti]CEF63774.1 Lethal (1) G0222 [Strongyloides ratti]